MQIYEIDKDDPKEIDAYHELTGKSVKRHRKFT
jgi:hypothetical protein